MNLTLPIKGLQPGEQRRSLNKIVPVCKCGFESISSLHQLVVCEDQPVAKISVLWSGHRDSIPGNADLCTHFAMEVYLRRATANSITVKTMPDADHPIESGLLSIPLRNRSRILLDSPGITNKAVALIGIESTLASSPLSPNPRLFAGETQPSESIGTWVVITQSWHIYG